MGVRKYQNGALVDTSELSAHVYALRSAGKIIQWPVKKATEVNARRIRDEARKAFVGTRHWKQYPRTIGYDVAWTTPKFIEAEVGPTMGRGDQGSFGHWLEYGTSRQGPIKPHLGPALDKVSDQYEADLLDAAEMTTEQVVAAKQASLAKWRSARGIA
jgi:hypothetical protein